MRSSEIARLLPDVFQYALQPTAGTFEPDRRMMAALEVMSVLHAPCEEILDSLDRFLDPRRAPQRFVPYLAGWVDTDWLLRPAPFSDMLSDTLASGVGPLRKLVAAASEIAQWRGTARGLVLLLETATGIQGFAVEETVIGEDGAPRPFFFRVIAPAEARHLEPLIERVITAEKPAFTRCELAWSSQEPTPAPERARKREDRT